jgi:hypothetical protein
MNMNIGKMKYLKGLSKKALRTRDKKDITKARDYREDLLKINFKNKPKANVTISNMTFTFKNK